MRARTLITAGRSRAATLPATVADRLAALPTAISDRLAALPTTVGDWVGRLRRADSYAHITAMQGAKATLAAVLAWYVAALSLGSPTAWVAPVTAVLMVQNTVYRSMAEGVKRVLAVAGGVLIAATAGSLLGLNALSLLVVVPLSLLAARSRWVGVQGEYITVTAVVLLLFGATEEWYLLSYVANTAMGAVIGAMVNLVLFPPGYQRGAGAAFRDLVWETGQVLRMVAEGLRGGWHVEDADAWYRRAQSLEDRVQAAKTALEWAQEGRRWNPWLGRARLPLPTYEPALTNLWHVTIEVQTLTRSLHDTAPVAHEAEDKSAAGWLITVPPLYDALVPLLESVAEVVEEFGAGADRPSLSHTESTQARLRHARELHRDMAQRLPQINFGDPVRFAAAGAILQSTARILRYLEQQ
jgi:hypothetical protein